MWKKVVRGLAIVAACIGTPALGGTLVERFGETHAELPDYLQFDCSDSNRGWIDAFGKKMRVPRHFERPNEASSALEWRIRLGNGPVSTQYASIRTDSMDSALEMFCRLSVGFGAARKRHRRTRQSPRNSAGRGWRVAWNHSFGQRRIPDSGGIGPNGLAIPA